MVTEPQEESADGRAVYTGTEEKKKSKGEVRQVSYGQDAKVREMRRADTCLHIIEDPGKLYEAKVKETRKLESRMMRQVSRPVRRGAGRKGQQWTSLAAYPTSPRFMTIPMRQACRRMWNVNFTPIYSVASWPTAFCAWAVTRAPKNSCCPSAASGAAFVRRVRLGAWPRPPPTWSCTCSPGCRRANGSSRCLSPYGIGWPHPRS